MKIVATSDWHGFLPTLEEYPKGDVLCIAGDVLPVWNHERKFQANWTRNKLIPYLKTLPFEDIILIAGNHDFLFQATLKFIDWLPDNVIYLQDQTYVIDRVKFHGTPWSGRFGNWAFMKNENELIEKWNQIPVDTDILIVHGPPHGACDNATFGGSTGSPTLREKIIEYDIPITITGHIHEAYGIDKIGRRSFIFNSSYVDFNYKPGNVPILIENNL